MSKVCKILLVICILSTFCFGIVFASEDEAVTDAEVQAQSEENELPSTDVLDYDSSSDITAQVKTVSPLSNLPEANLGLNNILNVILISIGVLLILFAIAILIRLKK